MKYSSNEILRMGEVDFTKVFSNKYVSIILKDGSSNVGIIEEIGVSACRNIDTEENLPVAIRVNGKNINIFDIASIEIA